MRRAKIVCTLGPSSNTPEVIADMIRAGMNVARLNFSHGTHDSQAQLFHTVREVSRDLGMPVAILQDLQGPKIRVGRFAEGAATLREGEHFTITVDDIEGNQERVSTTYKRLHSDVCPGDVLLLDDGKMRLEVVTVEGPDVITRVIVGGELKNNKGINLPTAAVSAPSLTEKDIEDLKFGLDLGVDYVALSFVRSGLDIHQLRAKLPPGAHGIKVISKIEKPQAIVELADIIAVSDGIMIARGDLGVELPPQKVPLIQKMAIRKANAKGRLTITATQMLDSMTDNPVPTRAEASDVANAVLDGTDAVMLSGESASGRYPVESVRMMASIIEEIESGGSRELSTASGTLETMRSFPNAVAKSAAIAAAELDVLGIVVLTISGATARLMMTYRPAKPIYAYSPHQSVVSQMALYWGVRPGKMDIADDDLDHALREVERKLRESIGAKTGDTFILVMGMPVEAGSETNLIKFHRIS